MTQEAMMTLSSWKIPKMYAKSVLQNYEEQMAVIGELYLSQMTYFEVSGLTDCEVGGFVRNSEGSAYAQLLLSGMLCLILCASVHDLDFEKQIKIAYII